MNNTENAIRLGKLGWRVFPVHSIANNICTCGNTLCKSPGKHPKLADWQSKASSNPADIEALFLHFPQSNIGIVTGETSGIIVLDVDAKNRGVESLATLEEKYGALPDTPQCLSGGGGVHYYFKYPNFRVQNLVGIESGIDIRGDGGFIVAPESKHISGKSYEWEMSSHPSDIKLADAPNWLIEKINVPKSKRRSQQNGLLHEGQRNSGLASIAGQLRHYGLEKDAIEATLIKENEKKCDPPLDINEVKKIAESIASYPTTEESWEPIVPFNSFKLPTLDMSLIPEPLRQFCIDLSKQTETPIEMAVMTSLGIISGAASKLFEVQVFGGWTEQLNLWTLTALDSGNRKTPVLNAAQEPIFKWEKRKHYEMKELIQQAEGKREIDLMRLKALASQLRNQKASKAGKDPAQIEKDFQELRKNITTIPRPPRLMVEDVTPEKLASLLFENDERVILASDEGGSILGNIGGRYSNGMENLDLILKCYSGSSYNYDRKSSPPIRLQSPLLALVLTPQPFILSGLFQNPAFRNRGFIPRFIFALPQSPVGYRSCDDYKMNGEIKSAYENVIHSILDIEPIRAPNGSIKSTIISLSPEARELLRQFQRYVESLMQEGQEGEFIRDSLSKLPGNIVRIAGIFHILKNLDRLGNLPEMSSETMKDAASFGNFLIPHQKAAFQLLEEDSNYHLARRILAWINSQKILFFSVRECHLKLKNCFQNADQVRNALKVLQERGFVRNIPAESSVIGRPSQKYIVRPDLLRGGDHES